MPGALGKTSNKMIAKSKQARPSTSGDNSSNRARRSDQMAKVKPIIKKNLIGPFC